MLSSSLLEQDAEVSVEGAGGVQRSGPAEGACVEILAQCNARKAKESNPSCQVELQRRTDDSPPRIAVTYVNGVEEIIDAARYPRTGHPPAHLRPRPAQRRPTDVPRSWRAVAGTHPRGGDPPILPRIEIGAGVSCINPTSPDLDAIKDPEYNIAQQISSTDGQQNSGDFRHFIKHSIWPSREDREHSRIPSDQALFDSILWLLLGIDVSGIHEHFLPLGSLDVMIHHHLHQILEPHLRLPSERLSRLGGVSLEAVDLSGPEVPGIDDHMSDVAECGLEELLHRVGLLGGDHVVSGLLLLQHHPHGLDVVPGEAPVAGGGQVAQEDLGLKAEADTADGAGDLAGDEVLATAGALVVEQDAVAGEQAVGLTVVDGVPVRGDLGGSVWRAGMERGRLRLGRRRGAEHLGGASLVVAGGFGGAADGLEEAESAGGDDIGGVVGDLEGDGNVGLGGEVVDLIGEESVDPAAEGGCIGEVGIVELHAGLDGVVGVDVEVV
ncbi:hypothetical protein C4D60_Mb02t04650 [Musa balbisiana]|uniref:Large ribosomal subunit protein mL53 n=1 Tax=Musa balbisiana TaxID=52838 RepID=A0A4V4H2F6_MUSBA|nr:hypothetical protein C4D60_Mb02t04650 [Musa balbisiana]